MAEEFSAARDGDVALAILETFSIAVLRRLAPREYALLGRMPAFYSRLFHCTPEAPNNSPWEHSDMLGFFLDDAESFFEKGQPGSFTSGIWQEEGVEEGTALIATALAALGGEFLIIRRLSDDYVDRTHILQKAREQLLERRALTNDLETYKQKSQFDGLTTLHNRMAFMEALAQAADRACKTDTPLGLLFLDIDNFKNINDTYGHLAGDAVLGGLGRLLRALLRRADLAARYGGEEFAILAPFSTPTQTMRLAEKLRKSVAQHSFGALPTITVSIGCADYIAGENPESFIQRADDALYDAKRSGRNCVRFR